MNSMAQASAWKGLTVVAAIAAAFGFGEITGAFTVSGLTGDIITFDTLIRVGILVPVVVGLNLLLGFAGQISLGQAGFYGLGAYASAITTARAGEIGLPVSVSASWWWPWIVMVGAAVSVAGLAFVIGRAVLRLEGHYLAMATLGLGIAFFILFRENFGIDSSTISLTGGSDGISGIPRLRIGSFSLWPVERYYFLVWIVALVSIWAAHNLGRSRVGYALRALRSSPLAAQASGIDVPHSKAVTFALAAGLASIAGSLFAHFQIAVSPSSFSFAVSLEFVIMASIGGVASVWGGLTGVVVIFVLDETLKTQLPRFVDGPTGPYQLTLFGFLLAIIMIFAPEGILHHFRRLRRASAAPETGVNA